MKKSIPYLLAAILALASSTIGLCADPGTANLKEASLVTEVLPWGETVTAVRLEYSEEIFSGELTALMPSQTSDSNIVKYRLFADRSITGAYVNNSGKKDDVGVYGKYVFLNLGIQNMDPNTYRSQVTFSVGTKNRPKLGGLTVSQTNSITTRSGKLIPPVTMTTSKEICVGIDDYTTFTYKNEATGHTLFYHLFIPRGYESKSASLKNLPLVVHFPSGDFNYSDWTGKYRGSLFSHHDALYFSDDDAQAQHPAFVVTVGGPADPKWTGASFADSEMQQNYLKVIQKILADYNVDTSRIYAVSLAAGSIPMWNTILANPGMFAAQISTSYDTYAAYKDQKIGEEKFAALLNALPGWFFDGLNDPTTPGILGTADTRFKGERLRDLGTMMNQQGLSVDVAYGKVGELMWNGLVRGEKATKLADDQVARAKAKNATHLVTLYIPGSLLISQHWSWDATYSNAGVRNWLFMQVNKAPYVP